jgi:hypothetical protein
VTWDAGWWLWGRWKKSEPPTPDGFYRFLNRAFSKRLLKTRGTRASARGSLRCSDPPQEIGSHIALLAGKGRSWGSVERGPDLAGAWVPRRGSLRTDCVSMLPLLPAGPGDRFCRQVSLWRGCTGPLGPRGCAGPVGLQGCSALPTTRRNAWPRRKAAREVPPESNVLRKERGP